MCRVKWQRCFLSCTPRSTLVYQHCTLCARCTTLHCVLINLKLWRAPKKRVETFSLPACLALARGGIPPRLLLSLRYLMLFFPCFSLLHFLAASSSCSQLHTRFFCAALAPSYGRRCAPRWAPNEFHFTDAARARNFIRCQTEFASIAPVAKVS